jgi:hypothetical protein
MAADGVCPDNISVLIDDGSHDHRAIDARLKSQRRIDRVYVVCLARRFDSRSRANDSFRCNWLRGRVRGSAVPTPPSTPPRTPPICPPSTPPGMLPVLSNGGELVKRRVSH